MGDLNENKERKPLMEKLEPSHPINRGHGGFHSEGVQWSRDMRGFFKWLARIIEGFWDF